MNSSSSSLSSTSFHLFLTEIQSSFKFLRNKNELDLISSNAIPVLVLSPYFNNTAVSRDMKYLSSDSIHYFTLIWYTRGVKFQGFVWFYGGKYFFRRAFQMEWSTNPTGNTYINIFISTLLCKKRSCCIVRRMSLKMKITPYLQTMIVWVCVCVNNIYMKVKISLPLYCIHKYTRSWIFSHFHIFTI